MADATRLSTGLFAQLACVLEATARKPGNVHRFADFDDLTHLDFLLGAAAITSVMDEAPRRRVGETVLEAIRATRRVTATNTNLGIVLLLAPLASVPPGEDLRAGVERVLASLDMEDSRKVFAAIRLARPGGMGRVPDQDVAGEPTESLRQVMALAAERDLVARQYVNGFRDLFETGVPALQVEMQRLSRNVETAIVQSHLEWMARFPDSLIARKRGAAEAEQAREMAGQLIVGPTWYATRDGRRRFAEFDAWLRAEGHARNPGTTADLVTASLFVALREGIIPLPLPRFAFDRPAGDVSP